MPQYVLHCPQGHEVVVDRAAAGLTETCACGARVAVPGLRELAQYKRTESAPAPAAQPIRVASSGWGMRQRILYVGGLLVLVFTGPLIYQIWHVPEMPHLSPSERAGIADETQLLTLQQSFDTWESLQAKLSSEESPSQAAYRTWRTMRYTWIGVFGAFTSLGLGMLAYGLSLPGKEPAARSKAIGK